MERLSHVMTVTRPEIVIHLAARAGVRPSIEQPQMYERTNVAGTLNLLELCRKFHVDKFIFGSSSSVYGATSCVPFSENQVELAAIALCSYQTGRRNARLYICASVWAA